MSAKEMICPNCGPVLAQNESDGSPVCPSCGSTELEDMIDVSVAPATGTKWRRLCCRCGKDIIVDSPEIKCECGANSDDDIHIEEVPSKKEKSIPLVPTPLVPTSVLTH